MRVDLLSSFVLQDGLCREVDLFSVRHLEFLLYTIVYVSVNHIDANLYHV